MSAASFLNFKELKSNIVNRKTDSDGGKVQWLNIRWLRFTKKEPYKIMFKYSISDDETFKSVNLKKEEKVDQSSFGLCQYFTQTADQFPRQNILTFSRYGNTFNPCTMGSIWTFQVHMTADRCQDQKHVMTLLTLIQVQNLMTNTEAPQTITLYLVMFVSPVFSRCVLPVLIVQCCQLLKHWTSAGWFWCTAIIFSISIWIFVFIVDFVLLLC